MEEKELMKKSSIYTLMILGILSLFWFLFSMQVSFGYSGTGTPQADLKSGSRINGDILAQPLNGSVTIYFGTQSTSPLGTGTQGYMGTNTAGLPFLRYAFSNGSPSVNFNGFAAVYINGIAIPSSGSVSNKLDSTGGVGTNNTFNNPTFAGVGTITATFGANGLVISPTEYSSVNNATGELQAQIDGKQPTLVNNTPGTITNALGYIPPANTQGSITTSLGYTPPANTLGSLTTSLGYTPPANTAGSITTALGYTPTDLGNSIALGTETTGNIDNISEGITNKYYTNARVNAAVGSLSVNTLNDVNIIFNENDFVKIVGGQLVSGSSTATVAFPDVTGSASASQLPLISGLLGSATSAQLPAVLELFGTITTIIGSSTSGRLYNLQCISYGGDSNTSILLHMDNPGTPNFVDSSLNNYAVTVSGDATGTTTAKLGSGGAAFDGTGDYIQIAHNTNMEFGTGNFTIDFWAYTKTLNLTNWVTISDSDSWGYIIGLNTSGELRYACGAGTWAVNTTTAGGIITTNTWQHIAFVRNSGTIKAYVDGVEKLSNAGSGNYDDTSAPFTVAFWPYDVYVKFNGIIDELRISKGLARWTSAFTPPTKKYGGAYNNNSFKYVPPGTTTPILQIMDNGTTTGETTYLLADVTTIVAGAGTITAAIGTSNTYSIWSVGAIRATEINLASEERLKENIKPIKIKPDLLDAEELAKQNYIAGSESAWIRANQANYETITNTGTGTITRLDIVKMESDYKKHIELEWASDINQNAYTKNIQKEYEKVFWQKFDAMSPKSWNPKDNLVVTRRGFIVGEVPDEVKGDDKKTVSPMAFIAYITKASQSLKEDTVFALSALQELITTGTVTQQKIDCVNDRLEVLNP